MEEYRDINPPNGDGDFARRNGAAGWNGKPQPDPELRELHALCAASAPGLFAICEEAAPEDDDAEDWEAEDGETGEGELGGRESGGGERSGDGTPPGPQILGWCLDFGETTVLTGTDGQYTALASSPAQAQCMYRYRDTRLIRLSTT